MLPNSTEYKAALYMRLSKDDCSCDESSSIITQRKMLRSFAKENAFKVVDEYIDDGWSGTNFDRPNFKRMIQDIEDKKLNLVITKDLSRLGRDYITTGQYTEIYFPSKKVRFIAINDGYDSANKYTDIAPFKNVINEMYARDTSQKIKSSFIAKMKEGNFIGNFPPYGYIKDPSNKNHLLVNPETSDIVKKIFIWASEGNNPKKIAEYLNKEGTLTPAQYRCLKNPQLNIDNYSNRKEWSSSTISKILKNIVYLGHTAQGKTTKVSFKSKVTIQNAKNDWIIVYNTHEPIIDLDTFEKVKKISINRTCATKGNFTNIFSGLAKCMDCGKSMSSVGTRKKGSLANLACGGYKLNGKKECSNHFIDYNVLYDVVLNAIREKINLSEADKKALFEEAKSQIDLNGNFSLLNQDRVKLECRVKELDCIIEKLYEDNFNGVINNDRLKKLLKKYEEENNKLVEKINKIDSYLSDKRKFVENIKTSYNNFSKIVNEYSNIKKLTRDILINFIDHIEIGQGHYKKTDSGKIRHQQIKIYFNFVGEYDSKIYEV